MVHKIVINQMIADELLVLVIDVASWFSVLKCQSSSTHQARCRACYCSSSVVLRSYSQCRLLGVFTVTSLSLLIDGQTLDSYLLSE